MKTSKYINDFLALDAIRTAYTGCGLRHALHWAGYKEPARLARMYLSGESAEYILAACIACDTVGA